MNPLHEVSLFHPRTCSADLKTAGLLNSWTFWDCVVHMNSQEHQGEGVTRTKPGILMRGMSFEPPGSAVI